MSLSENSPSPYLQVLSCASQQQRHMVDARQLLALYFTGDLDTVARFKERHASIETGYVPTLLDAHVLVAGTGMQMQRLSLEKLKKDAKRLLKRLRAEDSAAWLMMRQFHPASDGLDVASVKLADVQLVLARSNALASWPKLKAHIEAMQVAGVRMAALQAGDAVAPDADLKTLHIRCGSDLCEQIKVCGFAGQFVESNNPFIQGEVPAFDGRDESLQHFSRVRGAFLQRAFMPFAGEDMVESIEGSGEGTLEHMRFMQQLPGDTRRIVLWFEHDPYDQLDLAFVLYHLQVQTVLDLNEVSVELIQIGNFPGFKKFVGIGQLGQQPESLLLLWQQRRRLSSHEMGFGAAVWQAFTADSPMGLWNMASDEAAPLPVLRAAMLRVLQELPDTGCGLSRTQRLALEIIQEHGSITVARTFLLITTEREALPYLGDWMLFVELKMLLDSPFSPIAFSDGEAVIDENFRTQPLCLTATGEALLAGEQHWLELFDAPRWLGGVCCRPGARNWCWDAALQQPRLI